MARSPVVTPRLLLVSTVVALLAASGTYVVLDTGASDEPSAGSGATIPLEPADPAPDGDPSFTTFEGDQVSLASLRGGPLLVNFFASTCPPCVEEMPAIEDVYQELGSRVRFLGLAVLDRPGDARDLVERTGVTYPTALDPDAEVSTALEATVLPTTVLLDEHGEVLVAHRGALDATELRDLLASHLDLAA